MSLTCILSLCVPGFFFCNDTATTEIYTLPYTTLFRSSAPADRYRLGDGVTFGIIASTTDPFCRTCDRSRLTADGMWFLCPYATEGLDLRKAVRAGATVDELKAMIAAGWRGRDDRGAEVRLGLGERRAFVPINTLRQNPHLEMHTRGG